MVLYYVSLFAIALVWAVFLILVCLGLSAIFAHLSRGQVGMAVLGTVLTLPVAFVAGSAHWTLTLLT